MYNEDIYRRYQYYSDKGSYIYELSQAVNFDQYNGSSSGKIGYQDEVSSWDQYFYTKRGTVMTYYINGLNDWNDSKPIRVISDTLKIPKFTD